MNVLVLGLGASGLAMARWCAGQGARVRVWDSRPNPPQAAALADVADAEFFTGELTASTLDGIDRVYKSPGLSPLDTRLAPLLQAARTASVPVRGELDLFSEALAALKAGRGYAPKVIAITGTNGKTTTTSLTGQLVERAGRRVAVAGNIGPTLLDTLAAALAAQAQADAEAEAEAAAQAAAQAEEDARVAAEGRARAEADQAAAEAKTVAKKAAKMPAQAARASAADTASVPAPAMSDAVAPSLEDLPAEANLGNEAADPAALVDEMRDERPQADDKRRPPPEGVESSGGAGSTPERGDAVAEDAPAGLAADAVPSTVATTGDAEDAADALDLQAFAALDGVEVPTAALAADAASAQGGEDGEDADETAAPAAATPDDDVPSIVLIPPPPPEPMFSHLPQVWVLELSSFQLDEVRLFAPGAATVLNVTQDHLDWHGSMAAYAAAKARIFGTGEMPGTVMVVNRDEPAVEAMVPAPVVVKPAARGQRSRTVSRRVVRFGLDAPRAPGDFGLVDDGGMAWLVRARERDETIKRRPGEVDEVILHRLMPADALRIRGRHNASNALAALALASSVGIPLAPMLHGLREYRGEPHRVETIGVVDGIEFIDDSKGTNVGATVAALNGLGPDRAPGKLVVILGGDGKGQDFASLAEPLRRHARAAATIGKDAGPIEAVLRSTGVPFQRHATLEDATRWCLAQAGAGDAVLLSPACASLDMFRDYAHRAQVFDETMQALAEEAGGISA